jgi:hypothetical protein
MYRAGNVFMFQSAEALTTGSGAPQIETCGGTKLHDQLII